jgi:integrase
VDFQKGLISVPGTKTDAARRVIPMHPDLQQVLEKHRAWYGQRFGQMQPDWFVFPAGSPAPSNPRKPVTDFKHGWETVREKSGVQCRMHDLRHTFISRLAESGVPEVTLMELAGHVSRNMMLRYSHPRIEARREAVQAIKL